MGPFQEIFEFQSNLPDSPPIRFWAQGKVETAIFSKPKVVQLPVDSKIEAIQDFVFFTQRKARYEDMREPSLRSGNDIISNVTDTSIFEMSAEPDFLQSP